jgi:hypothetical protein
MSKTSIVLKGQASLVPEVVAGAVRQTPTLRNRPAWLKPQSADRIERILAAHKVAEQGFKTFAVGVVLAGVELTCLKKEAGPAHWPDVLTAYLEPAGITERHVDRYVDVANSAMRNHRIDVTALMRSPNSVDAETWARLSEHITATTNATTWRGLIDGMGMAKRETRGGYRADPDLVARFVAQNPNMVNGFDYEKWDKIVQASFRAWARGERPQNTGAGFADNRAAKRATANWLPTVGMLQAACDGSSSWKALPDETRRNFRDLCRKLADLIDSTLG